MVLLSLALTLTQTLAVRPSPGCGNPIQFERGSPNWYSMTVEDPALGDRMERDFVVELPQGNRQFLNCRWCKPIRPRIYSMCPTVAASCPSRGVFRRRHPAYRHPALFPHLTQVLRRPRRFRCFCFSTVRPVMQWPLQEGLSTTSSAQSTTSGRCTRKASKTRTASPSAEQDGT